MFCCFVANLSNLATTFCHLIYLGCVMLYCCVVNRTCLSGLCWVTYGCQPSCVCDRSCFFACVVLCVVISRAVLSIEHVCLACVLSTKQLCSTELFICAIYLCCKFSVCVCVLCCVACCCLCKDQT